VNFPEQWDPKSPWHDRRVRLAATWAIDRQAMNRAERLGFARIIWSLVPPSFEFSWPSPGYGYDPAKARQLLTEAGYPGGFDAGDYFCDASLTYMGEPVVNYLNAVGIRVKLRPIERAAFQKGWLEKKFNGSFGNAATWIEALVVAPIWQNVPLNGVGPKVEESGIGLVAGHIYSAPYEDVKLKSR
jgi:peptide/nickel transport system substrate-binding protein